MCRTPAGSPTMSLHLLQVLTPYLGAVGFKDLSRTCKANRELCYDVVSDEPQLLIKWFRSICSSISRDTDRRLVTSELVTLLSDPDDPSEGEQARFDPASDDSEWYWQWEPAIKWILAAAKVVWGEGAGLVEQLDLQQALEQVAGKSNRNIVKVIRGAGAVVTAEVLVSAAKRGICADGLLNYKEMEDPQGLDLPEAISILLSSSSSRRDDEGIAEVAATLIALLQDYTPEQLLDVSLFACTLGYSSVPPMIHVLPRLPQSLLWTPEQLCQLYRCTLLSYAHITGRFMLPRLALHPAAQQLTVPMVESLASIAVLRERDALTWILRLLPHNETFSAATVLDLINRTFSSPHTDDISLLLTLPGARQIRWGDVLRATRFALRLQSSWGHPVRELLQTHQMGQQLPAQESYGLLRMELRREKHYRGELQRPSAIPTLLELLPGLQQLPFDLGFELLQWCMERHCHGAAVIAALLQLPFAQQLNAEQLVKLMTCNMQNPDLLLQLLNAHPPAVAAVTKDLLLQLLWGCVDRYPADSRMFDGPLPLLLERLVGLPVAAEVSNTEALNLLLALGSPRRYSLHKLCFFHLLYLPAVQQFSLEEVVGVLEAGFKAGLNGLRRLVREGLLPAVAGLQPDQVVGFMQLLISGTNASLGQSLYDEEILWGLAGLEAAQQLQHEQVVQLLQLAVRSYRPWTGGVKDPGVLFGPLVQLPAAQQLTVRDVEEFLRFWVEEGESGEPVRELLKLPAAKELSVSCLKELLMAAVVKAKFLAQQH